MEEVKYYWAMEFNHSFNDLNTVMLSSAYTFDRSILFEIYVYYCIHNL